MELSQRDFRVMIFYDFKRGFSYTECHENLVKTFGEGAPSKSTINFWFNEFKRGRHTFEDEHRSGRPVEATTPENIDRVRQLIKDHRNITKRELEEALGVGSGTVETILHDHLGVRKIASRWIPHLLSNEQKQLRVDWCRFMLNKFDHGRSRRVWDIVAGDETRIYSYDPETKQQSTVWVFDDEQLPTKVTRSRSAAKQMVAVFFSRRGLVAAVPLVEQKTVNAEWYCTVCLPAVFDKLQETRPGTGLRGILLHHDNAPAHTAAQTIDFLHTTGVQLVSHPPYSPDLAPCDFYLFPEIKKRLRGKRYESANAAVAVMNDILDDIPKENFSKCFEKWFDRMDKCIRVDGCYFEKQ
jgi:histone-lysine N-methyltransferase SETMAR